MQSCITCKHGDTEGDCCKELGRKGPCLDFIRDEERCDCGQYLEQRDYTEYEGGYPLTYIEKFCPDCDK